MENEQYRSNQYIESVFFDGTRDTWDKRWVTYQKVMNLSNNERIIIYRRGLSIDKLEILVQLPFELRMKFYG